LRIRPIQEPVFSVANTDFEGGDDDRGYGDCIFWSFTRNPAILVEPSRAKSREKVPFVPGGWRPKSRGFQRRIFYLTKADILDRRGCLRAPVLHSAMYRVKHYTWL
jgi:hypothetical protein